MLYRRFEIIEALRRVKSRLLEQELSGTGYLATSREFLAILKQDISHQNHVSNLDEIIFNLIMKNASEADDISPGSLSLIVDMLVGSIESKQLFHSKRPTINHLERFIRVNGIVETHQVVLNALELAGFNGSIRIERSLSDSIQVESGYKFRVKHPLFVSDNRIFKPRIVLIDGHIETVAEIHQILEDAATTREHVVLMARCMSNDVLNTINVNNSRCTLNVHPCVIPVELDTINAFVDLSVACSTKVISSVNGDVPSLHGLSSFGTIDRAIISASNVVFVNSTASFGVKRHLNDLLSRTIDPSLKDSHESRIKSLTSRNVTINLVDDSRFELRKRSIERGIRGYSSMITHGCVEIDGASYPARSQIVANVYAQTLNETIERLEYIIA